MLTLTSSPVKFTATHVLHLIHPKDKDNPIVLKEIAGITCKEDMYIARAGESHVTHTRFLSFNVVVIHSCSPQYRLDFLKRLQHEWSDRLVEYAQAANKHVLVFGNLIPTVGAKVFFIPETDNVFVNDYARSHDIDVDTKGLGLTRIRCLPSFDPKRSSERYVKCIEYYSQQFPIYLLDSSVLICNNGDIKLGKLYLAKKGEIKVLAKVKNFVTTQERARKLKPIRAIYDEKEFTIQPHKSIPSEKEQATEAKAVLVSQAISKDT